jgi:hypothetical protein
MKLHAPGSLRGKNRNRRAVSVGCGGFSNACAHRRLPASEKDCFDIIANFFIFLVHNIFTINTIFVLILFPELCYDTE